MVNLSTGMMWGLPTYPQSRGVPRRRLRGRALYNVAVQTFSLEGKTAFVAGASRGIGLAIAREMKAAGADVILAARSKEVLEQRAAEIGGRALIMDVADPDSVAAAVADLEAPDILVNVAGTNVRKRFEEYTPDEYQRV